MKNSAPNNDLSIGPLEQLLQKEEPEVRKLFAKALNLYVSPEAETLTDKERVERLRQAILSSIAS